MIRPRTAILLVGSLGLAAGCHIVYPFEREEACEPVEILAAPTCSKQCVNPGQDADCDGLGNSERDPWPGTCNALLLAEEFLESSEERWKPLYHPSSLAAFSGASCGSRLYNANPTSVRCASSDTCFNQGRSLCLAADGWPSWSCGKLSLDKTSATLVPDQAPTVAAPFVETRFTLDAVAQTDWSVTVALTYLGTDWRYADTVDRKERSWIPTHQCSVWASSKYTQDKPGLHMLNTQGVAETGCWTGPATTGPCRTHVAPKDGDIVAGRTFVLQTWFDDSTVHCRLLDGTGQSTLAYLQRDRVIVVAGISQDLLLTAATSVTLAASAASVTVDHVRVFKTR